MKKTILSLEFVFGTLLSCYADGQQQGTQVQESGQTQVQPVTIQNQIVNLKYILVKSFNSTNSISLANINDFSALITDHKINHIFYNDSIFFIHSSTLTIPVSIASNGYKSIADFQRGNQIGYNNGTSYYYALEHKLNTQVEVDYFKQENFFSSDDYRQAQKDGYVKSNSNNHISVITGIIKKSDLEKNIYFANAIIYLLFYQQTDLVKSFLNNKDVVALTLPFAGNANRNRYGSNNIIVEFKTGYYYINLDIGNLGVNKDAIFYYACKFAQYLNYTDYQEKYSSNNQFTIKNSDTIAKSDLKYASYQECLNDINILMGGGNGRAPGGKFGRN
jgi:hypothetical protein